MPPAFLPTQKSLSRRIRCTPVRYAIAFAFVLLVFNSFAHFTFCSRSISPATLFAGRCCGPGCRPPINESIAKHYDHAYFKWQTALGRQKASARNWSRVFGVHTTDTVADLGAGGGHILATLNVSRRIAIDVNPVARAAIHHEYPNLIETYRFPEELEDDSLDIVYSTSAIEHFECPLTELRELARKVRVGGRMVIGVKNEGVQYALNIKKNDTDQHMYTWNRQLLYNLLKSAGFDVQKVDPSLREVIDKGRKWTHPDSYTTLDTYIYHWAYGIKPQPENEQSPTQS